MLAESLDSGTDTNAAPEELVNERRETYELLAGKRQQQERLLGVAKPEASRMASLTREIEMLRARASSIENRIAESEAERNPRTATDPDDLVKMIPANVLVSEFFVGEKSGWLFTLKAGDVAVYPLPGSAEIEKLARRLHESWRDRPGSAGGRLAASRPLTKLLFGPLGAAAPAGGLRIIPDGALHLVPMALLAQLNWPRMPPGSARVSPALSILRDRTEAAGRAADRTLAVVADPIYAANDARIQGTVRLAASANHAALTRAGRDLGSLQRLPATAIEARELLALVKDPADKLVLVGSDANRHDLVAAPLGRYRILHFATHALADSQDPALATLALSQWTTDGKPQDGALRLYHITRMRLNADLVVLSGCDTALGREIAGEGPIGLSHAFLRSGAMEVVATLWQVPDSSTAVLMREFYRQMLVNGRSAAVALQLAQDQVRRQAKWSDPYYWAGFQLTSNARSEAGNNNVARRGES